MKKNLFKKSTSIFLSVLMLMSCWVFMPATHEHLEAEAIAGTVYGPPAINGYHYSGTTAAYGTPVFDGNTDRWFQWQNGDDWTRVYYPSQIYLDTTETLQNAGYYFNVQWHFGDGASYRILLGANVWGDNKAWGAYSDRTATMNNIFSDYSVDASCTDGYYGTNDGGLYNGGSSYDLRIVGYGYDGQGSDGFDQNGIRHEKYVLLRSRNSTNNATIYLKGTPSASYAGKTTEYNTSGGSYASYGLAQKYGNNNKWSTHDNAAKQFNSKGSSSSYMEGEWIEMQWSVTIYDKSELNSLINTATSMANSYEYSYSYRSKLNSAIATARGILTKRATNQTEINNAKATLQAVIDAPEYSPKDVTFENLFSISDWRNSKSFEYDSSKGEIILETGNVLKIYKSISGGELTTGSSYPNSHSADRYAIPVTGGKDYTVKFNISNTSVSGLINSEVFLFWYDTNNNPVNNVAGSATFNNKAFSGEGTHSVTFTAPANAAKAEIRFDNDCPSNGSTIRFKNIMVYPAERAEAVELNSWTSCPATKTYSYNAALGTKLDVPSRNSYEFNGWYLDSNGNGMKDSGEEVTDANGNVVSNLQSFAISTHYNLYADWIPRTQDVGYDNLFSLSKWAMTGSVNLGGGASGNIEYDLDAGTITVESVSKNTNNECYTSYNSDGYTMDVQPNTEYIFVADVKALSTEKYGQMFIFCYDQNGNATTNPGPTVINANGTETANNNQHIGIYPNTDGTHSIRFRTPANGYKLRIRVGSTNIGVKTEYSDIGLFKLADYDAYAKDYDKVREPFKIGDTNGLMNPTRDGHVFNGWELEDGTKITSVEGLTESTTVYATWTKLYTVTYYNGDGSVLAPVKVKEGETVGDLPNSKPTKASDNDYSYAFDHWSANDVEFTADTVITADVEVFPIFIKKAHSNFTYSLQKASTCTENAIVNKRCVDCKYNFGYVTYNPDEDANAESHKAWLAKGHTFSTQAIVGSSTGENGGHYVKCMNCDATKLVDHVWAEKGTDGATCTTPGTVHWSCACDAVKTTTGSTAPDGHNFDLTKGTPNNDNATHTVNCIYNPAHTETVNCKDDNNDCYCDICEQELVHNYNKQTKTFVKSDADCYNDAVYYYTCQCGKQGTETWTDTDSKLAHNWENTETYLKSAADCENDAVYYKECSRCDVSSKDITGDTWTKANTKWNHNFTGAYVNNNNGTHNRECVNKNCTATGATEGCTYGDWTKDNADTHSHTCIHCSYTPAAENHNWSAWTSTDEDKESAGKHTRSCTVCDRVETVDCTYTSVETKVTCTEDGYTTHTCDACGHDYVTAGTKATGHNYTGAVQSFNDGTHNYLCKNGCGTYGVGTEKDATTTCTYKYKNNKDGEHQVTCTECNYTFAQGCSGGQATCTKPATCEKCNTYYGATAPHSFTGTPEQLEGDKHAYLCVYCSTAGLYGVGANEGATEGCSGGSATCTALAVCTKCGDTHGELKADAHKWGAWTNVAGTETHTRVCEYNADHVETTTCEASGKAIVDADCETEGYTLNTCDFCNHTWKTDIVAPLDHQWGAWVNNNDGTHTRTCERAGCHYADDHTAKTETASCTKENATSVVTAPKCLDKGYTTYTCKDCGYTWDDDYTDATGHSYLEKKKNDTAAYLRTNKDCVTDWTYWYRCDNCNVSAGTEVDKYDDITVLYWVKEAATGHDYSAKTATEAYLATEATCTARATYYYSCSVCGSSSKGTDKEKTFESGRVLDHVWENTETFKKSGSDCINNEVYYKECSRCHISSENVTAETWEKENTKSGHDFDHDNDGVVGNEGDVGYTAPKAAECLVDGVKEHWTCETCGKKYTDEAATNEIAADKVVISALKHDYKDIDAKKATCEEDGYTKHKQCQRCDYRNDDYEVIPALGHEFKAENGYFCDTVYNYHAYYCSRYDNCGAYGVDNVKYSVDLPGLDPEIRGGIKCDFTGEYVNYEDANGVHSHKLTCVCGNVSSEVCEDAEPEHVAPTCTEDGYYVHTCDVCGYVWNVASDAEEDKALTHDLAVVPNNNGTHSIKCQREGCDYAEAAEKCSTATPATNCGDYDVCDICKTAFGEAKPHVFTNYVSDNNAACNKDGTKTAVCDTCEGEDKAKDTITDEGSALKHIMVVFDDENSLRYKTAGVWKYNNDFGYDLSKWAGMPADFDATKIVKPTCKNDGLAISYCTREGCAHYTTKVASKVDDGHVWGEEVSLGGNCATGVTFKTECTLCGKATTRVETIEHTYVLRAYEPATCVAASLEYYVCSICGDDYENTVGEPLGHSWGEVIETKKATCATIGRGYQLCTVCQVRNDVEIEKLEHNLIVIAEQEATCTVDGYKEYVKCIACAYDQHIEAEWLEQEGNYTPATGHADGDNDGRCDSCKKQINTGKEDGCICHKDNWFMKIIYKILCFFWKLFGIGKTCDCGAVHY